MNEYTTLTNFRQEAYRCFTACGDALFDVADALLTDPLAKSVAELSLAPSFTRRWPSLYAALADGRIHQDHLRTLFARYLPQHRPNQRLLLALDVSTMLRPASPTGRDRTACHVSNLPPGTTPVLPGWAFSTIVALPDQPSSWTYVLDTQRISSTQTATDVGIAQLRALLPLLPDRALIVGDRGYGGAPFFTPFSTLAADGLFRIKRHQTWYGAATHPLPHKRGPHCKDGQRFSCADTTTQGPASTTWTGEDTHGKHLIVEAWEQLHSKRARDVALTVIRITRAGATNTLRDPQVSWFVWIGKDPAHVEHIWDVYHRRYSQEHGYRFDKQRLLWTKARLRTPEQLERWSHLVALVHNELVLAPDTGAIRRPWEKTTTSATPQQRRRGMARIIAMVGTPAHPPHPRGNSLGWQKGRVRTPAPRYKVVRKTPHSRASPAA